MHAREGVEERETGAEERRKRLENFDPFFRFSLSLSLSLSVFLFFAVRYESEGAEGTHHC